MSNTKSKLHKLHNGYGNNNPLGNAFTKKVDNINTEKPWHNTKINKSLDLSLSLSDINTVRLQKAKCRLAYWVTKLPAHKVETWYYIWITDQITYWQDLIDTLNNEIQKK